MTFLNGEDQMTLAKKGLTGALNWEDQVTSVADLPERAPAGQARYVGSERSIFVSDGTEWLRMSTEGDADNWLRETEQRRETEAKNSTFLKELEKIPS